MGPMTSAESRHVLDLPASAVAPRVGRQFVGHVLRDWQLADLVDSASLLTSEVVTNAVLHAGTASRLSIERGTDMVRVSVQDEGDGLAERSAPRMDAAGGHGLALMDTLADQWGARRVDGCHEVWFELRITTTD